MPTIPAYISDDPEKLQRLAKLLQTTPEELKKAVTADYAKAAYANPRMYQATGAAKGVVILHGLEQCHELASQLEGQANASSHLSHTLTHLHTHIALMIADYEERLAAK